MDINFLNKLDDIHSFVVLQDIFEDWVKEGVINEKALELQLGYSSLIAYPSIYLTKDGAEKEITAAKVCYEILMKYAKDTIKKDLISDDNITKLATSLMLLPPEKYILTVCGEFYNLHYFLNGLFPNFTDEQLANISGDDYAKVWLNIFSKGYHFDSSQSSINADTKHFYGSLNIISKMRLSQPYKEQMSIEKIKPRLKSYYHLNDNGCMAFIIFILTTSILIACSI